MPPALAVAAVNAVGAALALFGTVGALAALWQLGLFAVVGGAPAVAETWRHAGLLGAAIVAFFAHLPAVLAVGVVVHLLLAALGVGLWWRRPGAYRGAWLLTIAWFALALAGWAFAQLAAADLARGYPERAEFAGAVQRIAAAGGVLNVLLAGSLAWLLAQRAVRAQFRAGS